VNSHRSDSYARVFDPAQVENLVFGPITNNHLIQTVEYAAALRETIGGSAQAVTAQLQSQSQPLPSREDVTESIWPSVILETDMARMFGTQAAMLLLRKTNKASFRNIEAKVVSFIAKTKANFPGIMTGFHSTYTGWRRQWSILSHMESQIIVSRLKQLSFGKALALLLYKREGGVRR
jgi:hypothetical protein